MSVVEADERSPATRILTAGDRLDQAAFHSAYKAMPARTRAELVAGIVFMPSPLHLDHGAHSRLVSTWLGVYQSRTPGVRGEDNVSTVLGPRTEVQPDHNLRIAPNRGGRTRESLLVEGPPELVVEIARTSLAFDLGEKKDEYERSGVRECLVVSLEPGEVHWFELRDDRFARRAPDADGVHRSVVFPGLWLDPVAILACDLPELLRVLSLGLDSAEHVDFVRSLVAFGA